MNNAKIISIVASSADPLTGQAPVQWAISQLAANLTAADIDVRRIEQIEDAPDGAMCVLIADAREQAIRPILDAASFSLPSAPETLALIPGKIGKHTLTIASGSDARGMVYAILELADRVAHARNPLDALVVSQPVVEHPANAIRSIARFFTSEVEDKAWFHDPSFWPPYLANLVAQRFNRFNLTLGLGYNFPRNVTDVYFYFAYPYLLSVPGYNVRVTHLPDAERDRNLDMLRYIGEQTVAHGLDFQLALWTHACEWVDSPEAHQTVTGITPENHAAYCRDALKMLLKTCPTISGLTFRIHGESGIPEGSYDFWQTVFDGIVQCGRKVEIDMHAKGLDQDMIDVALATGMPVNISPKYWAEHQALPYHQAAIREQERAYKSETSKDFMAFSGGSRRFLRYSYGDLLRENRRYGVLYRIWPGTQRLLLWGDPAMAAGYGRYAHFCGCQGMELCEPLTFKGRMGSGLPGGREGYADASLRSGNDWEKYAYTYRLIGRLLYNPEADPDAWQRALKKRHGAAAGPLEKALAHASRILPLITLAHHPSASNNAYWPEIYTNMPIVDPGQPHPYRDTPDPKTFNAVSPLDPALFSSIDDYAREISTNNPSGRYAPLEVAAWLESLAETAESELQAAEKQAGDSTDPDFRRIVIDTAIQAGIGRFFADKLRAGVYYALSHYEEALNAYRKARTAWAALSQTASVYVSDLTFGRSAHLRGHWSDRLAAIDVDIEHLVRRTKEKGAEAPHTRVKQDLRTLRSEIVCEHDPPAVFQRNSALRLSLVVHDKSALSARLHYRRINQAETYEIIDMQKTGEGFDAVIPAEYTNTPYPLQYWFELRKDRLHFWPGLAADLSNQPYFIIRQATQ